MKFQDTPIQGAFIAEIPHFPDERGYLDVVYSSQFLADKGLKLPVAQSMAAWNRTKGTLRGMHYQDAPRTEIKLVACPVGAIYDVMIDLRKDSPSYQKWFAVELSGENHRALYIPEGIAHGYQTLADNSYVLYHTSQPYDPALARGVAWNDPAFNVKWPEARSRIISPRDLQHPPYRG
jgi:dTDP-4-dehydrorhamnose 3,5-epimerase